ncbi:MAG: type II toxin-antitoxin system RelE family toxin [Casimicrobium sp.]
MAWQISLSAGAESQLEKLDPPTAKRITRFVRERIAVLDDPRDLGKALHGRLRQYWSYRVGDYRVICDIQDAIVTILVVDVDHRKDVYKSN